MDDEDIDRIAQVVFVMGIVAMIAFAIIMNYIT